MGTRGFITFAADGREMTCYNHFDSYPEGLGSTMLKWALEVTEAGAWPQVRQQILDLRVVTEDGSPTEEDLAVLAGHGIVPRNWHGGDQAMRDGQQWYDLLRDTQGDPKAILDCGFLIDGHDFPRDSLFAEWGYVIDLDGDGWFEVYKGFQTAEHDLGRFAKLGPLPRENWQSSVYYPVALAQRWGLAELPTPEEFAGIKWYPDDDEE